jgi:hypothetical protein
MRDIRVDLQERLDGIAKDREGLQRSMTELDRIEAGILALLQREAEQFSMPTNGANETADAGSWGGSTGLARLVLSTLHKASRALSLDEIKEVAETAEFDFEGKSPGRVLHWALVGMAQGDSVEKVNGKWQIKRVAQGA